MFEAAKGGKVTSLICVALYFGTLDIGYQLIFLFIRKTEVPNFIFSVYLN